MYNITGGKNSRTLSFFFASLKTMLVVGRPSFPGVSLAAPSWGLELSHLEGGHSEWGRGVNEEQQYQLTGVSGWFFSCAHCFSKLYM